MTVPKPGRPVRGSDTGRPIMALLDLLGRRWVLRIIWELRDTPLTFRQLRERCDDMSPTVLNQRLHDLRETLIVEFADAGGYTLSAAGIGLLASLQPLLQWSDDWQAMLMPAQPES
ncbi:MAG: helix-turn-helix domain-containing protein [Pseudomonadota bacterium]